ncbi:hypothetical protein ACFQAV_01310 [Companilactobacillus huachuanensis]|uniref:WxL domain-containing protein n=1 Tax=Companilactobacillus huachuanensis TaxID=2559914 RepID=A0ABW1RHJ5_9LACO|nr:hypothetical protein [Companilactobacillus huachuanensis]
MALMAFLCFAQKTTVVQAYSDGDVLNNPPIKGLSVEKYFTPGDFTGNKASIISNTNADQIVGLTNGANQTSAIWSNNDDNYLNIDQKQTLSMWVYFGSPDYSKGWSIPDGMAFVLQNDGPNAISNINGNVNSGETLGVWGSDYNSLTAVGDTRVGGVPTVKEQAIQNSFAIEFDTYTNHYNNGKPVSYFDYKTNDTVADLPSAKDAFDYLPYNHDTGDNAYIYNKKDDQYSHIAWNYPARTSSYEQLNTANPPKSGFLGITSGKSIIALIHHMGTNNADENGNNVYLQKESTNSQNPVDSWRHVTIQYTPPASGSNNATLTYKVGDKNPATGAAQKPMTDVTIDNLDMTAFNMTAGENKLRYGFTAATGAGASTTSAAIFETMPSLVNAEVNAYTVDKTTNTRVYPQAKDEYSPALPNQNDNLIDTESLAMTEAKKIHPDDDLSLNYLFHYITGEKPASGMTETINIPTNVTLKTDSSGNIGKIHYISKNSSIKDKDVDVPASDLVNGVLTCSMDNEIGDLTGDNWEYARVELNATADEIPSGSTSLTVPATTAKFSNENYEAQAVSTAFDIVKPADTLIITATSPLQTDLQLGQGTTLTGDVSLKSGDTISSTDEMSIRTTLDDNEPQVSKETGTANDKFSIPMMAEDLPDGQHTVRVQVIDNNFQTADGTDTLTSNELVYEINVSAKTIVVTPDKTEVAVTDNEPITLAGTYQHSDNTSTTAEDGNSTIYYTITNQDGTKQDPVTTKRTNDGKYSFTLKPYAYDKTADMALSDYTGNTGLKVGTNIVEITVVDADGHKSTSPTDVTVNVPDITPTLTTSDPVKNIIQGTEIELSGIVGYDGDYKVTPSKLTWYINANGHNTINSYSGDTPAATPQEQDFTIDPTANGMTDATKQYTVSIYYTDPYGRESAPQSYTVNIIEKTAMLESTNYKFKNINANSGQRLVGRDGTWDLQVKSVMTPWTLTAKASKMVMGADSPNPVDLDGHLIFISKDSIMHNLNEQTFIQSDSDVPGSETTNIAKNWQANQGILLDVDSGIVAGKYDGEVEWTLVNGV